jgi:hypothetical protein
MRASHIAKFGVRQLEIYWNSCKISLYYIYMKSPSITTRYKGFAARLKKTKARVTRPDYITILFRLAK